MTTTMPITDAWKLSDEPDFRMISVTGADAGTFLQGQLTQNALKLGDNQAAWTASCNYQGRAASSALMFRIPDGYGLLVRASIAEIEIARLKKYVLRSKVSLAIEPTPVTFVSVTEAAEAKAHCPAFPKNVMESYKGNSVLIVRIPSDGTEPTGYKAHYVAIGELPSGMKELIRESGKLLPALMREGIALIDAPESLAWLPQAINLDLIGAISFNKGCYTGQEVIAKTQNLGRVKRRMFLGKTKLENLDANKEVFSGDEPVGRVIQSCGNIFLYVLRSDRFDDELKVEGETVEQLSFPYAVVVPESVI